MWKGRLEQNGDIAQRAASPGGTLRVRMAARPRAESIPYFVLLLSAAATAAAAALVWVIADRQDRNRFNAAADRTRIAVANRVEIYSAALHNVTALFRTGGVPNRQQFHDYLGRLDIQRRYPGVMGIGFSMRVPPGQREAFAKVGRENIDPGFRVWPDGPPDAECHTIYYLEPADERNRRAIGFDMHTEPARAAAMDAARDTAAPVASGMVNLVQDSDTPASAGFLIYVPLYKAKDVPQSVDERREKLYGYIYSPFRVDDMLRGVFQNDPGLAVDFRVYDSPSADPARLMHDSAASLAGESQPRRPQYTRTDRVEIAGRPWTIDFATRRAFERGSGRWLSPLVLVLGGLVSLTFFAQSRAQVAALVEGRRAREAAEAASQAKDRFLAVLSHELRTPLSPVLAVAGLWRDDPSLPPDLREDLRMVERNIHLEARLIDDLLDLTRIAQGKIQLHVEAVDVHGVLRHVVSMFRDDFQAKGLSLTMELEARRCNAWADPARLRQVFLNLVANAVKFTPQGGSVTVRSRSDGRILSVEVSDTGVGIDEAVLPRLFNAFEQGERAVTRRFGGLGLGLSIAKSLVEMHRGRIRASSAGPGRGATFVVEMEAVEALDDEGEATPSAASARTDAAAGTGEDSDAVRVLLVEDHADTRQVLVHLLTASGCAVTAAGSVAEARQAVDCGSFDVLVSDIGLPDGTGIDVMCYVRDRQPVSGIALTGFGQEADRTRTREAGFQAHLTKPVDFRTLLRAIQEHAPRPTAAPTKT
jgi:signal transduction histidine kinase/CheY-like chemotaxis protein